MQMVIGDGKRQRQIKEKRMLPREEVYDGALEDILCGTVTQCTAIVLPPSSNRHHQSSDDCLDGKKENYQVCSVQYCVQQ